MPSDNHDTHDHGVVRCSFCGKTQDQVRKLVKGPSNTFICDECVAACSEILEESLAQDFMAASYGMPPMQDAMGEFEVGRGPLHFRGRIQPHPPRAHSA